MLTLLKLCLVLNLMCITFGAHYVEFEYNWLDYSGGPMPKNALKVDETSNQSNVYVGSVYTKQYELLPATIRPTSPYATFYAYKSELYSNKNIKVVASQFKEQFEWISTSSPAYMSIPNLVQGGEELGVRAYFGRYFLGGQWILGKLEGALTFTINGKMQYIYKNFQVLTYRKRQSTDCDQFCCCGNI